MPRSPLDTQELRAWRAFLLAQHHVLHQLDHELEVEQGLSLGGYEVLLRLADARDRSMRMVDLAEVVLLSPSGLTRLIDRLVTLGLVERVPCAEDRRATYAHLTEAGMQRLRNAAGVHTRGIREHFTGRLSADQLRSLADVLEQVNGSDEPNCPQPPA